MSNPIKHHYISKFYLKNFTKSGGSKQTLFAYDKVKKSADYVTEKDNNADGLTEAIEHFIKF